MEVIVDLVFIGIVERIKIRALVEYDCLICALGRQSEELSRETCDGMRDGSWLRPVVPSGSVPPQHGGEERHTGGDDVSVEQQPILLRRPKHDKQVTVVKALGWHHVRVDRFETDIN